MKGDARSERLTAQVFTIMVVSLSGMLWVGLGRLLRVAWRWMSNRKDEAEICGSDDSASVRGNGVATQITGAVGRASAKSPGRRQSNDTITVGRQILSETDADSRRIGIVAGKELDSTTLRADHVRSGRMNSRDTQEGQVLDDQQGIVAGFFTMVSVALASLILGLLLGRKAGREEVQTWGEGFSSQGDFFDEQDSPGVRTDDSVIDSNSGQASMLEDEGDGSAVNAATRENAEAVGRMVLFGEHHTALSSLAEELGISDLDAESPELVAELGRALLERDREFARLEAAATLAWDTTVPVLEKQVAELTEKNEELASALEAVEWILASEMDQVRERARSTRHYEQAEGNE